MNFKFNAHVVLHVCMRAYVLARVRARVCVCARVCARVYGVSLLSISCPISVSVMFLLVVSCLVATAYADSCCMPTLWEGVLGFQLASRQSATQQSYMRVSITVDLHFQSKPLMNL